MTVSSIGDLSYAVRYAYSRTRPCGTLVGNRGGVCAVRLNVPDTVQQFVKLLAIERDVIAFYRAI